MIWVADSGVTQVGQAARVALPERTSGLFAVIRKLSVFKVASLRRTLTRVRGVSTSTARWDKLMKRFPNEAFILTKRVSTVNGIKNAI